MSDIETLTEREREAISDWVELAPAAAAAGDKALAIIDAQAKRIAELEKRVFGAILPDGAIVRGVGDDADDEWSRDAKGWYMYDRRPWCPEVSIVGGAINACPGTEGVNIPLAIIRDLLARSG